MKTYIQSPWSLSDLFSSHDSPEMEAAFAELEKDVCEYPWQWHHWAVMREAWQPGHVVAANVR